MACTRIRCFIDYRMNYRNLHYYLFVIILLTSCVEQQQVEEMRSLISK